MKLLLYINDNLFNELQLPPEEFESDPDVSFFDNVEAHKARVQVYMKSLKAMFYLRIDKAQSFEIWLIVESKMNEKLNK